MAGETTRFAYDHSRQRIKKTDPTGQSVTYIGKIMEVTAAGVAKHIFAGSQRIATIKTDASRLFYMTDHLRSSTLITDEMGGVVQRMDYEPYGAMIAAGNRSNNDPLFAEIDRRRKSARLGSVTSPVMQALPPCATSGPLASAWPFAGLQPVTPSSNPPFVRMLSPPANIPAVSGVHLPEAFAPWAVWAADTLTTTPSRSAAIWGMRFGGCVLLEQENIYRSFVR